MPKFMRLPTSLSGVVNTFEHLTIEHLSVMSLPIDGAITPVRAVELCIDIPIGES